MKELEERIAAEGQVLPGDILNYKPDPEGIEMEEDIYED